MKAFHALIFAVVTALAAGASADEGQKGEIKNTVGVMSEQVIRQRLEALGYADVKITKTNTLRYRIEAVRDGKPMILDIHPQTGETVELGLDNRPARTWHLPVEPLDTARPTPK